MRTPGTKRLDRQGLWDYALRSLGARAQSAGELRRKLDRRADDPEDVEGILAQLKEYGYLDDRRFAEGFATARLGQRQGSNRVVRDLRQRRVAPTVASSTVEAVYGGADESAMIEDWVRRKYRGTPHEQLLQTQNDLASAYRRLMHAGFRSGDIIRVLKRFAANPELLDNFEPPEESEEE